MKLSNIDAANIANRLRVGDNLEGVRERLGQVIKLILVCDLAILSDVLTQIRVLEGIELLP